METLPNADIFFIVTTVVVILIGASMATALYYFIKILREVRELISSVKNGAGEIFQRFKRKKKD